ESSRPALQPPISLSSAETLDQGNWKNCSYNTRRATSRFDDLTCSEVPRAVKVREADKLEAEDASESLTEEKSIRSNSESAARSNMLKLRSRKRNAFLRTLTYHSCATKLLLCPRASPQGFSLLVAGFQWIHILNQACFKSHFDSSCHTKMSEIFNGTHAVFLVKYDPVINL
ncbi:hypothetical protein IRJ41_020387, partial [Triplophysa rosa]